jgi:hypothetical protein
MEEVVDVIENQEPAKFFIVHSLCKVGIKFADKCKKSDTGRVELWEESKSNFESSKENREQVFALYNQ